MQLVSRLASDMVFLLCDAKQIKGFSKMLSANRKTKQIVAYLNWIAGLYKWSEVRHFLLFNPHMQWTNDIQKTPSALVPGQRAKVWRRRQSFLLCLFKAIYKLYMRVVVWVLASLYATIVYYLIARIYGEKKTSKEERDSEAVIETKYTYASTHTHEDTHVQH